MQNDKTNWIWNTPGTEAGDTAIPAFGDDEPTRELSKTGGSKPLSDEQTTRFGGSAPASEEQDEIDPVTGWLVVVKGPGRGVSVNIGSGMSTVGRGSDQRISFPFGDRSMSRNHVRIIYDPNGRNFFIAPGEGKNLTRVNGELLLGTLQLGVGDLIELGDETHVRFIPFCGPSFDWSDDEPKEGDDA